VTGFGWRDQFIKRTWPEVRDRLASVRWSQKPDFIFEIIDSVIGLGGGDLLAVTTSMHDLVIAPLPVGEPPNDVIILRAPGSLYPASSDGLVPIDYVAVSGRSTTLERPVEEAVPFFWRFVETEFGLRPRHGYAGRG
jgi:hypothetical protein